MAPGVLEPVSRPLLLCHGQSPTLGGQPGPAAGAYLGLLQAAEQRVRHRADRADGELPAQVGEVGIPQSFSLLLETFPKL